MKKRVSIRDVAEAAGASVSTVSRVISNPGYPVSAQLRKRILDSIRTLNYSPTNAAQTLKKGYSNTIGLVVRDIADPYFWEIAKGVTEKAVQRRFLCFVCSTGGNQDNEIAYLDLLWQHKVKGIILAGGGIDTEEYYRKVVRRLQRARSEGIRIIGLAPQAIEMPTVSVDYSVAASLIMDYLYRMGSRRIALLSGTAEIATTQEHLKGYRSFLVQAGLPFLKDLVAFEEFSERGGYAGCRKLLGRKAAFDALFCGNDTIAIGALHYLAERGLKVPDDVSLIGIGDFPQASFSRPPLTTVRVPRYAIGARAVEMITQDEAPTAEESVLFRPTLVVRQSVRDRQASDNRDRDAP